MTKSIESGRTFEDFCHKELKKGTEKNGVGCMKIQAKVKDMAAYVKLLSDSVAVF